MLKDHDVVSGDDAQNVSFEHFVYSIGEGKASIRDTSRYDKIEPMYYYSEMQVTSFIESLGFRRIFVDKYNNVTKVYSALYQKI